MSKFWVIFKREYAQVVKKKSFIIGIILTPAIMAAFVLVPAMMSKTKSSTTEQLAIIDQSGLHIGEQFKQAIAEYKIDKTDVPYYNVDQIFELQPDQGDEFTRINDSLRDLILNKDLKYYLVVRPNAQMSDSNMYLVTNSDNFVSINRFENKLSNVVSTIRLQDSNVNVGVDSVLKLTKAVNLELRDAKGEAIPFEVKYFTAFTFVMIIYVMIFGYGQMIMRSVIEEKNSRIMEVLVSSVSPFQLMMGKVLGLGAATFTQVAIWIALGAIVYSMKATLAVTPALDRMIFNPAIIIFFVLYLVTGYILYSTIFALIGSIVNSEKEAQSFVMPVAMIIILPIIIGINIIQEPHSTLAVTLSLIPFLTPTMMMMRVVFLAPSLTSYSLFSGIIGEALLGFVLVVITLVGMVWLTAKIFRIGILMYGKRPTLPEIIKWVKY